MNPPPKKPGVSKTMLLAVGENIIERVGKQAKNRGLALACLNPGEKYMAEYMVSKGILLKIRVEGVVSLFLAPRLPSEMN